MRKVIPALWMISMYALTAATINNFPCPIKEGALAGAICELEHIITHAAFYAIQNLLLIVAMSEPPHTATPRKLLSVSMGIIVWIGIGQEVMQMILRSQLHLLASAFDILVDASGAGIAGWLAISRMVPEHTETQL